MADQTIDHAETSFDCPLVGREVLILRDYRVLHDRGGQEIARAPFRTECSDMDDCPIATHHGSGSTYNWSKCAFVKREAG